MWCVLLKYQQWSQALCSSPKLPWMAQNSLPHTENCGNVGEAHWLRPPTPARHHSNHLHELFYDRRTNKTGTSSERNTELISLHQLEEFGKGQKETPCFRPHPRILLSDIHLGWTRRAPPGRTLSQNDWLKTIQKLIPSPWNPRLVKWQSCSPGFPYSPALHPGALSQWNLLLFQHMCLLGQFISEC